MRKAVKVKIGVNNIVRLNTPEFAGRVPTGMSNGTHTITTDEFIYWQRVISTLFKKGTKKIKIKTL